LSFLRDNGFTALFDYELGGLKNQFKKADKAGAQIVVVIGSNEIEKIFIP